MADNLIPTPQAVINGTAFPKLKPADIELLRPFGTPCSFEDGEMIFRAAGDEIDLFIIESGEMEIQNPVQNNRSIVFHGPGQFSGDIDLLTRRPPIVNGISRGRTDLLRISGSRIREVLSKLPHIGEILLDAALERRR